MPKRIGYVALVAAAAVAVAFVLASPSQAKHNKKMAEPAVQPFCVLDPHQPVCGEKDGMKFTFANSCFASREGAKIVAHKACEAPKAHKTAMKKPIKKKT
jgi:hypothetical protein